MATSGLSSDISDRTAKSAGPDWDQVPFDVGCARCGHDLRGSQEPICRNCGLTFDWADALPLEELTCLHCGYHLCGLQEQRCPECGRRFVWEMVLDDYRRRKKPLFEYRWGKEPVRGLRASWSLGMRPWKLWRTIDLHDPPSHLGLLMLLGFTVIFFVFSAPLIAYVVGALIGLFQYVTGPALGPAPPWTAIGYAYSPYGPLSMWYRGLGWYETWLTAVAAWWLAGLSTLLVLRQSMRLCKVRASHVFRICVYALIPLAIGHAMFWMLLAAVEAAVVVFPSAGDLITSIGAVLAAGLPLLVWFWTLMSVALGYRLYIRMRHAWAVAIASQIIALLVALNVTLARVFW